MCFIFRMAQTYIHTHAHTHSRNHNSTHHRDTEGVGAELPEIMRIIFGVFLWPCCCYLFVLPHSNFHLISFHSIPFRCVPFLIHSTRIINQTFESLKKWLYYNWMSVSLHTSPFVKKNRSIYNTVKYAEKKSWLKRNEQNNFGGGEDGIEWTIYRDCMAT